VQSIPLQDVDCTIEGREVYLGVAKIERAEEAIAEFGMPEMVALRGRSELRLVIYFSLVGTGAEVERIAGRKAHGDIAAVIPEEIVSVGEKFAVEKDVALGSLRVDVVAVDINQTEIAADGGNVHVASATNALERTADGFYGEIAGRVLQLNPGSNGFDVHVSQNIGDGDGAGIVVNLKLGVLRDANFVVRAKIGGRDSVGNLMGHDVHAIAGLLDFEVHFGAGAIGDDHDFVLAPCADGDDAVGIMDGDDGGRVHFEVLFETFSGGRNNAAEKQAGNEQACSLPVPLGGKKMWGIHRPYSPRSLICASKSAF